MSAQPREPFSRTACVLDAHVRPLIDPLLNQAGAALCRRGVGANTVTMIGLIAALVAATAIAMQTFWIGLAFIILSRVFDGLDGAVARCSTPTDLGGYLDTVCDYVFYTGIPLGFAFAHPNDNAFPAAALLATFVLTCASFLTFAVLAAKRQYETVAQGRKSFFYSWGLMEGTETVAFFIAMAIWPGYFPELAWAFASLCAITTIQRTIAAVYTFR